MFCGVPDNSSLKYKTTAALDRMVKLKHRKNKNNKPTSPSSNLPTDQDIEDARRLEKLLHRIIPTHIILTTGTSSDAHSLSIIQTLIDRRIKLLSRPKTTDQEDTTSRKLNFVVLSTSNLASTISLTPSKDTDDPTVTIRSFKNSTTSNDQDPTKSESELEGPFNVDLIRQLSKICNDQFTKKLSRNLHGIFIHCGLQTSQNAASSLLKMLQVFFLDNQPGIQRLDLQGVVTVLRPIDVNTLDVRLCALTDRFVLACVPQISPNKTEQHTIEDIDTKEEIEDVMQILSRRNPRAEIVQGQIGLNKLLSINPKATQQVDEIFAYSRVVVTQIFPDDDDFQKPIMSRLRSPCSDDDSMENGVLVILPNHKSVDLTKFHFWMESLLSGKQGKNIFRIKGLLAVRGSRNKYVVQCVGMSFGIEESHEQFWNQSRRCTLLVIGKKLNGNKLRKELMHCIASEGCMEKWYWWADAHCCVLVLILILIGCWGGLAFMASIDYGIVDLSFLTSSYD